MCRQGHGPFGEFGPFGSGGLFGAGRMGSLMGAFDWAVSIILGSSINRFKSVQFRSIRFAWAVRFGGVRLAPVDLGRFDLGRFDSGRFDRRQSIGRFDWLRLFWAGRLAPVGPGSRVGAGRFGGWVGLIDSAVPFGRSIWSLG